MILAESKKNAYYFDYTTKVQGQPMVRVHCMLSLSWTINSVLNWFPMIKSLETLSNHLCIDSRGHGWSGVHFTDHYSANARIKVSHGSTHFR